VEQARQLHNRKPDTDSLVEGDVETLLNTVNNDCLPGQL